MSWNMHNIALASFLLMFSSAYSMVQRDGSYRSPSPRVYLIEPTREGECVPCKRVGVLMLVLMTISGQKGVASQAVKPPYELWDSHIDYCFADNPLHEGNGRLQEMCLVNKARSEQASQDLYDYETGLAQEAAAIEPEDAFRPDPAWYAWYYDNLRRFPPIRPYFRFFR